MKLVNFLFVLLSIPALCQTLDYNSKKGLAVEGYDVVSYFNNEPKKGLKKLAIHVDNITYLFSSKENLITFRDNPEKYMPQYGGYCAYAVALKGKKVSIDPKTYKIIHDKLYLFYKAWGANTLDLWNEENEEIVLNKGDKNWRIIQFKK
ncbi:YHS domain-containing (seleno)protein [Aestuariivivens sediminis]|uniref:YHS domain-containing (seleno)protein n=1 Tax=Aestuariivivens sediminis TaxID=2913557 RepID=UPI001F5A60B1|nr:YHS domain-containing (seleno)protein [Aestuariivivens sediminis]